MRTVLFNVFACKIRNTREHCVLIRELAYINPRLSSSSRKKFAALSKVQARTCKTLFGCRYVYLAPSEQTELLLLLLLASRPPLC
jgi:hypothetical protein